MTDVGAFQGAGSSAFPAPQVLGRGGAGEPKACHGEQICIAAISWRDGEHFQLLERMSDGVKASIDLLKDRDEPLPMGRHYES